MIEFLEDITNIKEICETSASKFQEEIYNNTLRKLFNEIEIVAGVWSGSWLGYHSTLYLNGLTLRKPDEVFDANYGLNPSFLNRTRGDWQNYSYNQIEDTIFSRAKVKDLKSFYSLAEATDVLFEKNKKKLLAIFKVIISSTQDIAIKELLEQLQELKSNFPAETLMEISRPQNFMTSDYLAVGQSQQGVIVPHHINLEKTLMHLKSYGNQIKKLGDIAEQAEEYIKQKFKGRGSSMQKSDGKVFIGHGRSNSWLELQNFIRDRLHLEPDEFNRESAAGLPITQRLEAMLNSASFAFLIMTAEDEHADSSMHARENVIHEVGLFQGKLSFQKAIVLLEEGCTEFSNIHGLGQIRFPKGRINAVFENVRAVLEREGILKTS